MLLPRVLLVASIFAAAGLPAQTAYYGFRDLSFPNTSGTGTKNLACRVYYPSTRDGASAPLVPQTGGYPVVVLLHGFSALGSFYSLFGRHFAREKYVVVLPNTAQFSANTQVADALALFPALKLANSQTGHPLRGAYDMSRVGLTGHSMGGGSTFRVLAANLGFRCGIGIAPVYPGVSIMRAVQTPVGTIHGKGDRVLPWASHSQPLFTNATAYASAKFFYLFNSSCDHSNLAGLSQGTQASREVWARSVRVLNGFFDRYVKDLPSGMEETVGLTARAEAKLDSLQVAVRTPDLWLAGVPNIGSTVQPVVLCEPGMALIATSVNTANVPSPFGTLRLDPATIVLVNLGTVTANRLLAPNIKIPNDPSLRGAKFPLQGLGPNWQKQPRLTNLVTVKVN